MAKGTTHRIRSRRRGAIIRRAKTTIKGSLKRGCTDVCLLISPGRTWSQVDARNILQYGTERGANVRFAPS